MQDRVGGSKIVVLASHSTGMLRDICNKGIVMEQGRLVHLGEIGSALEVYHRLMDELLDKQASGLAPPCPIECHAYGHVSILTVSYGMLMLGVSLAALSRSLRATLTVRLRCRPHINDKMRRGQR